MLALQPCLLYLSQATLRNTRGGMSLLQNLPSSHLGHTVATPILSFFRSYYYLREGNLKIVRIGMLNRVIAMIDQSYLNLLIFGVVWLLANGAGYIALWILSEEVREKPSELDLGLWIFAILVFVFATFLASLTYPPNSKEYLLAIIAWLLFADVLSFLADLVAFSRYAEEKGWP